MSHIMVLGAGLVGSVIARDLAADDALKVTVVDVDADALLRVSSRHGKRISTRKADLRDAEQVRNVVREADLVVGAVPGWLGYAVLHEVIAARKSFVDISFMPEDPRPLGDAAEAAGVVGLVDFGVAPGMSNVLATRAVRSMERADDIRIYVGGLPQVRRFPYEYAAVFSPADVIEEYTRPSRLVEQGNVVVKPALSEIEPLDFEGVGTLEAFNTDGLRSLMWTLDVPNMREKTLRYPGHATRMRMLRETGFLSSRHVRVGNVDVRPVDLTLALFASAWKLPEGEGDITVLRIEARGVRGGEPVREAYDLLDRYDPETKTTSMARTTGFPCAIAARMLLAGKLALKPGLHFPEAVASDPHALKHLLDELAARGVTFRHSTGELAQGGEPGGPRRLPTV